MHTATTNPARDKLPAAHEVPAAGKEPGNNPDKRILLSLNIDSVNTLQQAFVPIIEGGGLFIPDQQAGIQSASVDLGSQVFLLLRIRNPDYQDALTGRVVWLKPPNSSGGKSHGGGFALQFPEAGDRLRQLLDNQSLSGKEEPGTLAIFA